MRKPLLRVAYALILILLLSGVVRTLAHSLFFTAKERVNVVFYGKETRFFSLDTGGDLHYFLPLYSDLQTQIPGGYGYYRIGALGKFVHLEKKPELLRKTFSNATSTFIDYYFYPVSTEIYYGKSEVKSDEVQLPTFKEVFFTQSNASLIDKVYIYSHVIGKRPSAFNNLTSIRPYRKQEDVYFSVDKFNEAYLGYFFHKRYRNEKKNAQIQFATNAKTAYDVARIIEGNGIRIGDIAEGPPIEKGCFVKEGTAAHSETAKAIADFFDCSLKTEKTGIYDILVVLGDIEKSWETK
jgi:hypothetical protein